MRELIFQGRCVAVLDVVEVVIRNTILAPCEPGSIELWESTLRGQMTRVILLRPDPSEYMLATNGLPGGRYEVWVIGWPEQTSKRLDPISWPPRLDPGPPRLDPGPPAPALSVQGGRAIEDNDDDLGSTLIEEGVVVDVDDT